MGRQIRYIQDLKGALKSRYSLFIKDLFESDESYMDIAISHQKKWATLAHMTHRDRAALLDLILPEECPKGEDKKKYNTLINLYLAENANRARRERV